MLVAAVLDDHQRDHEIRHRLLNRFLVIACMLAVFSGCGGSDPEPQAREPAARVTATATPKPESAPEEPDTRAAIAAARDELPDVPLREGTRIQAAATGAEEVCVDRIISKASARTLDGGRRSHVTVSWPDLAVGEPQDGPCAKAQESADAAIEASRRYYLRTDDDANALDEAVAAALDGAADGVRRIARVRERIERRLTRYLLDSGDTSVGANLLLSAATPAREAAENGNLARLAEMRGEIVDARSKLAEEVMDR